LYTIGVRSLIIWTGIVLAWVLICSGGWYVATKDDYRRLAVASGCYGPDEAPKVGTDCAGVRASDVLFYREEIDRKARNSRLAGAGGAMAIVLCMVVMRRR
jgi:hypothetical protein